MAAGQHIERRVGLLRRVDGLLFGFAALAAAWLAFLLFRVSLALDWRAVFLVAFWVLFTYLLLPRVHRILTLVYVPGYFIGRTRTSDGLLGDPVNVALRGAEDQIHAAMGAAGWTRADDLSLRSGLRIVTSTLSRRSYRQAPVSPLMLFDRQQDFAYQQEVAGNPAKRHHVRFWRCPDGWLLPGGCRADWLAAGTYDRSVGLSLFTLQITHKIDQHTDVERDHIVTTLRQGSPEVAVRMIEDFATGYHSRNGGGDLIETDGDLPVIDVRRLAFPPATAAVPTDSRDRRPAQIVFGGVVTLVLAGLWAIIATLTVLTPDALLLAPLTAQEADTEGVDPALLLTVVRWTVAAVLMLGAAVAAVLGVAVMKGRTWIRLVILLIAACWAISSFVADVRRSEPITATSGLLTATLSILVMMALTSHRAREYTARRSQLRQAARLAARTKRQPALEAPASRPSVRA